ncbi:MAG: type II toxin-antitoxin system VapB family antitoxin [Lentisphaerae bacterium]|nr:type II toxin-antitoxin system VapB family antitoxin [Lentisphaerota bacterium]MBT4818591.1 type II toxin-antitoxin system VapB family antitoxin [Lentisphaerota bacterium]MBT5612467.1 type II toxin-antitoxin system VapB family antitoxin [Lentisphaerota bacterium]MBT7061894.1 type II toxin-antitoxin system VapB family antitoxin [Lentisphaerota bacterium]MBT7845962.1 type II toxin-antitoxin system VapB family antitoxin [Lentisphaerota bacterium]
MRTTLTIDDPLLKAAEQLTGEQSRSKAVNAALTEWVRLRRLQELKALRGTMDIRYELAPMRALEVAEGEECRDGAH